ncbi:MAG: response regulator [Taibaiella sp.]|nr:response regulator [Taibaiella sp.]
MNELRKSARILIIDDDEDDFFITSEYIRSIPSNTFTIDWVGTYKAGLEKLAADQYDLYFVDYRLGAKSGVDFLIEAQNMGAEAPIVLLTGQGNHAVDIAAMESGAVDYLIKGELNVEKTERCIRYALGRSETLKALKRSEAKFRGIFEKSKDIVFIADRSLQIVDVNEALTTLLGLEDADGVLLTELVVSEDDRQYLTDAAAKGRAVDDYPVTLRTASGNALHCTVTFTIEGDSAGTYVQGIVHDITNLRKAEKATLQTEKLAATGRVVRTLAHEIKNPLNNITMSAAHLQTVIEAEDDKLYLEIIQRNSMRINELINELLQSSIPRDTRLKPTSLQEIVEDVMSATTDKLTLKRMQARVQCEEDTISIMADIDNLKLALLNVVINAIEAMKEDAGILSIDLQLDDDNAVLVIADNGCGISDEHIGRIFEPYYTRKRTGAGLGLAFTLNILKAHKATIDVTSAVGKGTAFTIAFPVIPI